MKPTKKLLLALASASAPILILSSLEASLWLAYKATGKGLLRSGIERLQNYRIAYPPVKVGGSSTKVAIFGGSSSMGYASPISFGEILEQTLDNVVIHNYGQPGAPFAGYQSHILKALMPYYDIIIVYAGHNEIHSYNYTNVLLASQDYVYPNGHKVTLDQITQYKRTNDFNTHIAKNSQAGKMKVEYLRLPYAIKDIVSRIRATVAAKTANIEPGTTQPYPYYAVQDSSRSGIILSRFSSEIESIRKRLRSNQKLVISTVMSNDIYPPVVDSLPRRMLNQSTMSMHNKKAHDAYSWLAGGDTQKLKTLYNYLPSGAHRQYIQTAADCKLDINNEKTHLSALCLDRFREARRLDNLPYRVIPSINYYIKRLANKYPNVIVIDPSESIEKSQKLADYLSYFVDFQHPSEKGHLLIATLIARDVFGATRLNYSYTVASCENARRINISWLHKFIEVSPAPYVHKYYQRLANKTKCNA